MVVSPFPSHVSGDKEGAGVAKRTTFYVTIRSVLEYAVLFFLLLLLKKMIGRSIEPEEEMVGLVTAMLDHVTAGCLISG